MAVYTIKDLETLSGVKAHTIRIWEQRYALIHPGRTHSNIRYYEDCELKFLLNVALLNKNGFKISKLACMNRHDIADKVAAISEVNFDNDTQTDAMTIAMIEMDECKFDRVFAANVQQIGFERTMLEVIYPFLGKLSVLWLTGSLRPVQESFMSSLVRQKIIAAIDREPPVLNRDAASFMLYLTEGDNQELSMLFLQYLLKSRRQRVIYLGMNIQIADLCDAYRIHKPTYLFTMLNEDPLRTTLQKYVDELVENFRCSRILLTGYQVMSPLLRVPERVHILPGLQETIEFIDEIRKK
jgi:MerR family transcriptional regulator, light-induced transcriptional regulator